MSTDDALAEAREELAQLRSAQPGAAALIGVERSIRGLAAEHERLRALLEQVLSGQREAAIRSDERRAQLERTAEVLGQVQRLLSEWVDASKARTDLLKAPPAWVLALIVGLAAMLGVQIPGLMDGAP